MKKITSWVVFVLVISLIFLQGCAADKSFVKKDLTTLAPLKVVYHETPSIRRSALGGTMFSVASGPGAVVVGDAVGESGGKEAQEKRYDFGYIVMKTFIETAKKIFRVDISGFNTDSRLQDYVFTCANSKDEAIRNIVSKVASSDKKALGLNVNWHFQDVLVSPAFVGLLVEKIRNIKDVKVAVIQR